MERKGDRELEERGGQGSVNKRTQAECHVTGGGCSECVCMWCVVCMYLCMWIYVQVCMYTCMPTCVDVHACVCRPLLALWEPPQYRTRFRVLAEAALVHLCRELWAMSGCLCFRMIILS